MLYPNPKQDESKVRISDALVGAILYLINGRK